MSCSQNIDHTIIKALDVDVSFVCPHCGDEGDILEMSTRPTGRAVLCFTIKNFDIKSATIESVEISAYGNTEIEDKENTESFWICSECRQEIDSDIKSESDLFFWLRNRYLLTNPSY